MSRWRDALLGVVVACAIISTFVTVRSSRANGPNITELMAPGVQDVDEWERYAADGQVLSPKGDGLVVVFTDFECPYCKQFAEETLHELTRDSVSPVRVVYRQYPIPKHRLARHFAVGAVCADAQGRFAQFHDHVFALQDSLGIVTRGEMARRSGVADLDAFEACAAGDSADQVVRRAIGAGDSIGVRGTPAVLMNGKLHFGTMSAQRVRELLAG